MSVHSPSEIDDKENGFGKRAFEAHVEAMPPRAVSVFRPGFQTSPPRDPRWIPGCAGTSVPEAGREAYHLA